MSMIGDVLAALKATSEWNDLVASARRVPDMERRVAELESRLMGNTGSRCPSCGQNAFRLIDSKPDEIFGALGGSRRTYKCTLCGFGEEKIVG